MPSNKWTQGTPLSGATTRAVLAERVYYAASNTAYSNPAAKLDGADPAGWSDLGIVGGSRVTLTYTKEVKPVMTGIEQVRRGSYTMARSCKCSFTLEQYDLDTMAIIGGLSISSYTGGGRVEIGSDDIVEKALLFTGTNKVDGKEYHHHCGKASLAWNIDQEDDARVLKVDADLYLFNVGASGGSVEAFVTMHVLD
jgi:hypothetical protein